MKRYEGENIRVTAFNRSGDYILRIEKQRAFLVATRNSRKPHIECGWDLPFEKTFEDKTHANNYFRAIRKNHPDLRLVSDNPNQYIDHEGKIREF